MLCDGSHCNTKCEGENRLGKCNTHNELLNAYLFYCDEYMFKNSLIAKHFPRRFFLLADALHYARSPYMDQGRALANMFQ